MQLNLLSNSDRDDAIAQVHSATAIYTRSGVINELLDDLNWPERTGLLCDPSCGDGAFLEVALERLLAVNPSIGVEQVRQRLVGWEFFPCAVEAAKARLCRLLLSEGRSKSDAEAIADACVVEGDFLTDGPTRPTFDLIAGNPPYLRFLGVPEVLRSAYQHVVPEYAQKDLMHCFLDRCADVLRPGGAMGLVTADRWLFNQGAEQLRCQIGRRWKLANAKRMTTKSAFYRPKNRVKGSLPRIHPVSVILSDSGRPLTTAPIYPGAEDVHIEGPPLGSIAHVRLAPWLGPHGIFTIDSHRASSFPESRLVPIADVKDCEGGAFQPRGHLALRTEGEGLPEVIRQHLDREMVNMPTRGQERGSRYLPPEGWEKAFSLDEPLLLIPRIALGIQCVRIPAGVLPVNHGNTVVRAGQYSLDAIETAITSDAAQAWIRARAPRLENDYLSITTTLLRSLPVPLGESQTLKAA